MLVFEVSEHLAVFGLIARVIKHRAVRGGRDLFSPLHITELGSKILPGQRREKTLRLFAVLMIRDPLIVCWRVEFLEIESRVTLTVLISARDYQFDSIAKLTR